MHREMLWLACDTVPVRLIALLAFKDEAKQVTCLQSRGKGAASEVTAKAGIQVFAGAAAEHLLRAGKGPIAEGGIALWGIVCIIAVTCTPQRPY